MATGKKKNWPEEVKKAIEEPEVESTPAVELPPAPEPVVVAPLDIVAKVLELQQQLVASKQQAIDELLKQKEAIEAKLTTLGYSIVPTGPIMRTVTRKAVLGSPTTEGAKGPYCRHCQTSGHDARAHRGQSVKRAFTPEELAALSK